MLLLALAVLSQIGTGVSPFLTTLLDYKVTDARTKRFKLLRTALFVTTGILLILGVGSVVASYVHGERDAAKRDSREESLREQLAQLRAQADSEAARAAERATQDQARVEALSAKLEPFIALARQRHGALPGDAALVALRGEFEKLTTRTTSIESSIAQRHVPEPVAREMRQVLEAAPGCRIIFSAPIGDQEALQYAELIRQAFEAGGWRARGVTNVSSPGPIFGVRGVTSFAGGSDSPCASAANRALRLLGLDARIAPGTTHKPDDIEVTIGARRAP